jgi:hypothetical protein
MREAELINQRELSMIDKDCGRPKKVVPSPEEFRDFRWTHDEHGDHLVNHCWYSIEGRYCSDTYKPAIVTRENNSWYVLHELLRKLNDELWPSSKDGSPIESRFIIEMLYDTSLMHFTSAVESWRRLSKLKIEKQDELAELEYAHFHAQTLVSSSIVALYSSIDVLSHLVFCIDGKTDSDIGPRLIESVQITDGNTHCTVKGPATKAWYYDYKKLRSYLEKDLRSHEDRHQVLLNSIPISLSDLGEKLRHALVHRMFIYVVPVKTCGQWLMLDPELDFATIVEARKLSVQANGGSWDIVFRDHKKWFYSEKGEAVSASERTRCLLVDCLAFVNAVCEFIKSRVPS